MINLLDTSLVSESHHHNILVLRQLQSHLQQYLYGFENKSLLQFTFNQYQADQTYQLLVSMQILIESLQQLQQEAESASFDKLRLSPFTM